MTVDTRDDCSTWNPLAAERYCVSVDVGFKADRSVVGLIGLFETSAGPTIAVQELRRFPLQTPNAEVIEQAANFLNFINRNNRPAVLAVDSRNNVSFVQLLAEAGIPPEVIVGCNLTSAERHASRHTILRAAAKVGVREFTLSRTQLFRDLATAFEQREIQLSEEIADLVIDELAALRFEVGDSGHAVVRTPSSGHDDCAVVVGYALWALRFLGQPQRHRARGVEGAKPIQSIGWT